MSNKNRRRSPSQEFLLYDDDESRNWRFVRRISFKEGENLELAGKAVRVEDETTGQHVGWKLVTREPVNPGREILSDPTPSVMNVREMELVSGVRGRSRTMGLPPNDERRLIRVSWSGHALPPEDAVERAVMKLSLIRHREVRKVLPPKKKRKAAVAV